MALGIAGVDLIMDIRDLSYDISHWGQAEQFGLILALDLIAQWYFAEERTMNAVQDLLDRNGINGTTLIFEPKV